MVRGTTVRFTLTILSAVLLAMQFFAPTASFTSAHRTHVTTAGSPEVVTVKRADNPDEVVSCGDLGHLPSPTGPLRARDRNRLCTDSVPEPLASALPTPDVTAVRPSAAGPAPLGISRSSVAHTPAALQVFRH